MDFKRTFQREHHGEIIKFSVIYHPETHTFNVTENDEVNYILTLNPFTSECSVTEDPSPSIPLNTLAEAIRKEFKL